MQIQRNKKKYARGFTLIELVIVIAVIAILAALLVPTILGQAERARISRAKSDAGEIAKALARIRTDTSFQDATTPTCYTLANISSADVPGSNACGTGLDLCSNNENKPDMAGMPCWGGPYMSAAVSVDPWGQAWKISYTPATRAITVTSNGPDKSSATTSDDIVVTQ